MEDRCDRVHKNKGFLCDKTGYFVRAKTLVEVGLEYLQDLFYPACAS